MDFNNKIKNNNNYASFIISFPKNVTKFKTLLHCKVSQNFNL